MTEKPPHNALISCTCACRNHYLH